MPDLADIEARAQHLWEQSRIHEFDPDGPGPVFSVDTPPPYVSAAHLHVGHAMSYAQAEFVVRYQRRRGRRVFYPMGFDDNGLPTERYVEQAHGVDRATISRSEFRRLCLDETRRGAATYEALWRALGLSVDWRHRYSTIDDRCRRIAQASFLDLWRRGRIYRTDAPVQWDPQAQTSLSQADIETRARQARLYEIAFSDGARIATTRPELLPACVALYRHPDDARWAHLDGATVTVPLFGHEVPLRADADVRPDFGTGLLMVCTFGDGDDVERWRRDGLPARVCLGADGRLTAAAGDYRGETCADARKRIVADLGDRVLGSSVVDQVVSVGERTGEPIEWQMRPHWVLRVLDLCDELLDRSAALRFHPDHLRSRLDDWIRGLRHDWNLTRQRFYGVPFPVWFCTVDGCPGAVGADERALPVDPLEDRPPVAACPDCGGELAGDPDVMDTWMTSSMSPAIVTDPPGTPERPLTVRVQAHEIIRTWLFTSLVKAHLHDGALPWSDVMISGWGLDERGRKISKRALLNSDRYDPMAVIHRHGADALRFWAAGTHLGSDSRYSEREVRTGRKVVLKLWNVARFVDEHLLQTAGAGPDASRATPPPRVERPVEDRWLLHRLAATVERATAGFDRYDYATAREATERFFWNDLADTWIELVKHRVRHPDDHPAPALAAAGATGREVLGAVVGLWAPFLPHVTEEIYQRLLRGEGGPVSVHVTPWPRPADCAEPPEMPAVLAVLQACRALRGERRLPQGQDVATLTIDAGDDTWARLEPVRPTLLAAARAGEVRRGPAERSTAVADLRVDIA
ncbi:MAG TPA: valine--tRNA ligase [Acidimicrobiales bacterium]|nr:valine--tRNA ligase [Acidimicrobiales bacterium]